MLKSLGCMILIMAITGLLVSGCRPSARVITKGYSGRRVHQLEIEGNWIAYVWYPAELISLRGHLVLLNTSTGEEIVLDDDFHGSMAFNGGRVIWWNAEARDEEGKSDLLLYDLDQRESRSLAHAKIKSLDIDGDHIVWEETYKFGSDIVLFDIPSGSMRTLSTGGREETKRHEAPRMKSSFTAWISFDYKRKDYSVTIHNLKDDSQVSLPVDPEYLPQIDVSEKYVVYAVFQEKLREVHLYDVSAKSDRILASLPRLSAMPRIEGEKIVWCEHIEKKDFKGIPGQPLFDEKSTHDVFVYEIATGRKQKIAGSIFSISPYVALYKGRVYMTAYRELPPPGESNMIVPIDLWVW